MATATKPAATDEPQTPAARRAAGLPPSEQRTEPPVGSAEAPGAAEPGMETPAAPGGPESPPAPADAPAPTGEVETPAPAPQSFQRAQSREVSVDTLTADEVDLVRKLRSTRGQEILEKLAAAPIGVGTDADPYVLYHLRGCPEPTRTEVFEADRPNGQKVTIVRCIECGVQNVIDH